MDLQAGPRVLSPDRDAPRGFMDVVRWGVRARSAARAKEVAMLDPQTRQQLQTKFQQVKPQLKQRFSGVTDQDLDTWRSDPDKLIATISQKTGEPTSRVEAEIRTLVGSA